LATPYRENNPELFGKEDMIIYEPCNYASNVAYYHSATRVCDYPDWSSEPEMINAHKRAFSTLAMGSAMWHGSHTFVGYSFDNNMIALISYLGYQSMVSGIGGDSTIIKEISSTPRSMTGIETTTHLT
jgi:hypothetical protein